VNKLHTGVLAALLVLSAMTATVIAKGNTVRLTVAGPSLLSAVEVVSPDALTANVFTGNFIGNRTDEPDRTFPRYTVSFYIETLRNPVRMMYVVGYVRNPQTGQEFVYLPGRGEEWYRLNVSTILRRQEGEWHHADGAWSNAIAAALHQSSPI
jgi:hypothetical protein